uniref:Histidine N-acetyltransferase C-terminal domain-containing protein n=1 Tax=Xenopus tropicalis TaxID=8364 RepID=A0A1B8Y979_XENTR
MSDFSLRDVQILPATASNYSEVMAISNGINDGLDYLPYKYHEWLADPNRSMFIAKFKGKVAVVSVLLPNNQMEDSIKALRLRVKRDYVGAPPVVLSPLEVLDLFENPCILEHLFPKGLLIGGSLPLAAHKCNLKLMLGSGLLWIYSKSTNSYTPSSSVTQCSHPAPTHINPPPQHPPLPHVSPELLSLSSAPIPVPLAKGTHCLNIDHFGTNPRFVQGHILHHLVKGTLTPKNSSV